MIQSGVLGVREEEKVLSSIFDHLLSHKAQTSGSKALVDLTSGYFSLLEPYQQRALREGLNWRILAASPKVKLCFSAILVHI